jgi:predicted nucleic acid-binding protein
MTRKVLDAYAILSWMQGEAGAAYVQQLLRLGERKAIELLMSAVNVGEVYYRLSKQQSAETAASFLTDVKRKAFPWRVVPATNERVWAAAKLKGRYAISYADAFAMALAQEVAGELVTRDEEIRRVAREASLRLDLIPED